MSPPPWTRPTPPSRICASPRACAEAGKKPAPRLQSERPPPCPSWRARAPPSTTCAPCPWLTRVERPRIRGPRSRWGSGAPSGISPRASRPSTRAPRAGLAWPPRPCPPSSRDCTGTRVRGWSPPASLSLARSPCPPTRPRWRPRSTTRAATHPPWPSPPRSPPTSDSGASSPRPRPSSERGWPGGSWSRGAWTRPACACPAPTTRSTRRARGVPWPGGSAPTRPAWPGGSSTTARGSSTAPRSGATLPATCRRVGSRRGA
mgnify:CR=1 FL=1